MFQSFYLQQRPQDKEKYRKLILGVIQVSGLFSENDAPFIHYRTAENIFCNAFSAQNKSRDDTPFDAVKLKEGIGIKTFLGTGSPKFEKIAEFNDRSRYPLDSDPERLIRQIAQYRNNRINEASRKYGTEKALYHCLVRSKDRIILCEYPMLLIDEAAVNSFPSRTPHILKFKDGHFNYHFHLTKNTLYKEFVYDVPLEVIHIPKNPDPILLSWALKELTEERIEGEKELIDNCEYVVLPLFSPGKGAVPAKSGLNIWNAAGRSRNPDEVYISIPRIIHKIKPGFFPPRDQKFILRTYDKRQFSAKICQDGGKALMSDPNKDLGQWILRDVLGLKPGTLVTYEMLRQKEADTVIIYKIKSDEFLIALHSLGGFQKEYGKRK